MKVTKILHSCFALEVEGTRGLIDPALVMPVNGAYVPRDGTRLELDVLFGQRWDFVFVSHSHRDHFDPYTLVHLSRETLILHGTPASNLAPLFTELGFHNQRAIAPWQVFSVGPMELMPIPTSSTALETGLAVRAGGASFVHLIDIHTDDAITQGHVARWGEPQLLSPINLCSNEHFLSDPETCLPTTPEVLRTKARPFRAYGAGHVILSGHDLAVPLVPWVNHRLFPSTPEEHLAAFRAEEVAPVVEIARPGQWWQLAPDGVRATGQGTPGVASGGPVYDARFDPNFPVRPFADRREFKADVDRDAQIRHFEMALLRIVVAAPPAIRDELRQIGHWRYQIHYPDGVSFDAVLDMRQDRPTWLEATEGEAYLTMVTASGFAALSQLLVTPHSMRMCDQFRSNAPISHARMDPLRRYSNVAQFDLASIRRALSGLPPWQADYLGARPVA